MEGGNNALHSSALTFFAFGISWIPSALDLALSAIQAGRLFARHDSMLDARII